MLFSASLFQTSMLRRLVPRGSAGVGQGSGFLAPLARELLGHLGVKLSQPDVEGALEARGLFLALGRRQVAQPREVVFELEHQAIAFEEIFVAIHRRLRNNSKDYDYRLTFRCPTTDTDYPGYRVRALRRAT